MLAGIHAGDLQMDCVDCQRDLNGCENPTQLPVWGTEEYEFYVCPMHFLTPQIISWGKHYNLIKNNISKPINYETTQAKWIEAIDIYELALTTCQNMKTKNDKLESSFKKLKDMKNAR